MPHWALLVGLLVPLVLISGTGAALPPGYDEELWCPAGTCLRRREQPRGWVGPRSAFNECVGAEGTHKPRAWGEKLGADVRARLVAEGYTQAVCADGKPVALLQRRWRPRSEGTAVLPRPSKGLQFSGQHRLLGQSFSIALVGSAKTSSLIRAAAGRFLERLERLVLKTASATSGKPPAVEVDREALTLQRSLASNDHDGAAGAATTMEIRCTAADPPTLSVEQAEGYTLGVRPGIAGVPGTIFHTHGRRVALILAY